MKKTTKKAFNVAIASVMAAGAVVAVAPQASAAKSFSDVPATNDHYADITKLVEAGHINGFEDGTYRPNVSVTRGQAAKIIANVLGLDTTNVKDVNFKDLQKSNIYYGPIAALAEAGIINGFEDNTYRPNGTLTRGQMAKIIALAFELKAGETVNPFTDSANSIYADSIVALFANEVTKGKTATSFAPNDAVTRGQLASFVIRANDVYTANKNIVETKATIKGIENGKVLVAGEELEVASNLTGFFAAKNAAALKDAELTLVVEYTTAEVASVTPVAALVTGKIIGVKSAKFVAEGTTFDADGVEVPLVETAKGMTLQNLIAEELVIAGNVVLANVAAETVTITGDAKITIDKDTTITKLVIPAGKKIEDVIANYAEVKEQLANVKVENAPAATTPPAAGGGGGGATGGGAGGAGDGTTTTLDVANLVTFLTGEINSGLTGLNKNYLTIGKIEGQNIPLTITNGDYEISEVKKDLATQKELKFTSLVVDYAKQYGDAGRLFDEIESITINANGHPATYTIAEFIDKDTNDVEEGDVKDGAKEFITEALKGTSITKIGDFKTKNTPITLTVTPKSSTGKSAVTYTVIYK
ncbi:S-layer homology domain-containing protein [Solibacillus sp. FSL H8-0523]|uniref:S-layer homology domain-containing protein n=1 Tax=Solibacillus sp. FSL H8-0523 TaxID=2954511 RepID=UPI00310188E7